MADHCNICIVTPSYNRAYNLKKLYSSLKNQSNKCFSWLIVDDGSTDHTSEIVNDWIGENNEFKIKYIFKTNGGKHTALNLAFDQIQQPLTFIVDSDDYLTNDAIESIDKYSNQIINDNTLCGIAFLRGYNSEKCIGDKFKNTGVSNWNTMRYMDEVKGDKAEIWKTEYLKKYKYPVYSDERFIGEDYIWCQMSEMYNCILINKIIYVCNYLEDGLTNSGRSLRIHCPKGGMDNSKVMLSTAYPIKYRVKYGILYGCYSKFANLTINDALKYSGHSILILLTYPAGCLLHSIWRRKYD